MKTFRISFFKILIELLVANLLNIFICSIKETSSQGVYIITVFINALICLLILGKLDIFKLKFESDKVIIYIFKLGHRPQQREIYYEDLVASYLEYNIGRGIQQRQLKLFVRDELIGILTPSFSGWQHSTLDQISHSLQLSNVAVQTE